MKYEEVPLKHNEEKHNFELWVDEKRSFIDYKKKGDVLYFLHTEVPTELEGRGIAAALVEKSFIYMEESYLKLVPLCTYTQAFLKRHPEWNRLLQEKES